MKKTRLSTIWMILTLGLLAAVPAQAADYAVIVNSANSYSANPDSMRQVVKQLFLKERSEWPGNIAVKAFGRPAASAEHKAFLKAVLGMTEVELASHWIALKQKTGQAPPREIPRDSLLIKLVAKYEGGLAVVSKAAADAAADVRTLFTFSD